MQVTVKLFATLRIGRFREEVREYPEGTSIEKVIAGLDIPDCQVMITLINGKHAKPEDVLIEGDVLSLLPVVSGG